MGTGGTRAGGAITLWVVDRGNTRVKVGGFDAGGRLREVHLYESGERGGDAAALAWLSARRAPRAFALLSTAAGEERWRARLGALAPVWTYAPGSPAPLRVAYATPATLGVDRLAAAVAAAARAPGAACLVVDAGTCITTERVSAAGVYLGGTIAPGLRMRLRAMHEFTGKLPLVSASSHDHYDGAGSEPDARRSANPLAGTFGTDTPSALWHGAVGGAALEVAARVAAFRAERPGGYVVVSGGDGPFLRPLLPSGPELRPHLVLEGLAHMYAYAQSPSTPTPRPPAG